MIELLMLMVCAVHESEREACQRLAEKFHAQVEVELWDRSRCDLVTEKEAIEVDWAAKWAEAIGQASYYAILLDRQPAVMLLIKDWETDSRHVFRCLVVCTRLDIRLYIEKARGPLQ